MNIPANENIRKCQSITNEGKSARISPPVFQFISDIISVILSYSIQFYIRFISGIIQPPGAVKIEAFIIMGASLLIYWMIIFWFSGLYKNWFIRPPFEEFYSVVRVAFVGSFLMFFFILLEESNKSPQMMFLSYFAITSFTVGFGRFVIRVIQKKARIKGIVSNPALLIGTIDKVKEMCENINKNKSWGYKPAGIVLINGENNDAELKELTASTNLPILGGNGELPEILKAVPTKEVLISVNNPDKYHGDLLKIVAQCYDAGKSVVIDNSLYHIFTGQMRTLPIYGMPMIVISPQLLKPWQSLLKRLVDIIFSLTVIAVGMPFWILIGIIVKMTSKGPVFYSQERVGKDSKNFLIYKFRSMAQDAEKHGPQWAKVNDPRVTPFGKFLRKSHLDEIPQFWNVLKGDMSLVGPRPERPVFVEKFSEIFPQYKRRLILRPGITGWWQIHYTSYAESNEEIQGRLKDDFYYIENISLKLDLEIVVRTVFAVLKGHGQA